MKYAKIILVSLSIIIGIILTGLPILLSLVLLWNLSKPLLVFCCLAFPVGVYLLYRHVTNDLL